MVKMKKEKRTIEAARFSLSVRGGRGPESREKKKTPPQSTADERGGEKGERNGPSQRPTKKRRRSSSSSSDHPSLPVSSPDPGRGRRNGFAGIHFAWRHGRTTRSLQPYVELIESAGGTCSFGAALDSPPFTSSYLLVASKEDFEEHRKSSLKIRQALEKDIPVLPAEFVRICFEENRGQLTAGAVEKHRLRNIDALTAQQSVQADKHETKNKRRTADKEKTNSSVRDSRRQNAKEKTDIKTPLTASTSEGAPKTRTRGSEGVLLKEKQKEKHKKNVTATHSQQTTTAVPSDAKAIITAKPEATDRPKRTRLKKEALMDVDNPTSDSNNCSHQPLPPPTSGDSEEKVDDKQLVSQIVKGAVPVDSHCPEHELYHVRQTADEIWDVMLNQTNVGNNNNKYYLMQVLERDDGLFGAFLWCRWGRVGHAGQSSLRPYTDSDTATSEFKAKYQQKTHNTWKGSTTESMQCFEHIPGWYTLIEMDYSDHLQKPEKPQSPASQLDPRVFSLIELICDLSMMSSEMIELGYDAKKLPLGKLSKRTITMAYEALNRIDSAIRKTPTQMKRLEQLSSEFYTLIPHNFGFQKMRNFTICDLKSVRDKLKMLESLSEIEVATRILEPKSGGKVEHPADVHYRDLKVDLRAMDKSQEMYQTIVEYVRTTHGKTHNLWSLMVRDIFEVARQGEGERYKAFERDSNRMLLWHGSRLSNYVGILSQGLRIAPKEAPATGFMFGKGVYFADVVSKSAQYCFSTEERNVGCLLLCEVALGSNINSLYEADSGNSWKIPVGRPSTKGVGKMHPDPKCKITTSAGVQIPLGKVQRSLDRKASFLQYNEYVVYDIRRVRIKYLVKLEFVRATRRR